MKSTVVAGLVASPVAAGTAASFVVHADVLQVHMPVGAAAIGLIISAGFGLAIGRASGSTYPERLRSQQDDAGQARVLAERIAKPTNTPVLIALDSGDVDGDAA